MKRWLPFIALILPTVALAAPATYNLLAPLGTLTGAVTLSTYLEGIIKVIVGVAGVLAVVMIVICAIQMMGSPSVSQKSASKECITNALFGLLIAIGSWIILNTINTDLLKSDFNLNVLSAAPAPAPVAPASDPMPTKPGFYYRFDSGGGIIRNSPSYDTNEVCGKFQKKAEDEGKIISQACFNIPAPTTPPPSGSEVSTRNSLCGASPCISTKPLSINKLPCTTGVQVATGKGCTNVEGLPGGTVSFLTGLPGACACDVIITGGTEAGHSSHGASIPVFDLAKTTKLYNFIKTNATIKANPSFCTNKGTTCHVKYLYGGYWFTDEDAAHWHVCKDGTVAPAGKSAPLFVKACTKV